MRNSVNRKVDEQKKQFIFTRTIVLEQQDNQQPYFTIVL
jgi:hypothetical protein